jgi:glycosyltransferase involved in cell wall biosynthesis
MPERGGGNDLVLHVIPTRSGRGAQRSARELVDHLNAQANRAPGYPRPLRHQLLCLLHGPPEVDVDVDLDHRARSRLANRLQPGLWPRLVRLLHDADPAAVVAHGSDPLKFLVLAMVVRRRPLVYCAIGTYSGPPDQLHIRRWRRFMNQADHLVAVGDEVLDECVTCFAVDPARATMIANGRDPAVFHPGPDSATRRDDEPVVAFVGALTGQKRPDVFVDLVGALRDQGRRFRAVVVGDGPMRPVIEARARSFGVELLGQRQDVADVLRGVDVLVFPSAPAGEGMPGVLIEAGLTGIPVVATDVPGVRTVIADGVTGLVVGNDVLSLAAGVGKLLDDPGLRTSFGRDAIARCQEHFTTDQMVAHWDALLHEVVAEHARGRSRPRRRG